MTLAAVITKKKSCHRPVIGIQYRMRHIGGRYTALSQIQRYQSSVKVFFLHYVSCTRLDMRVSHLCCHATACIFSVYRTLLRPFAMYVTTPVHNVRYCTRSQCTLLHPFAMYVTVPVRNVRYRARSQCTLLRPFAMYVTAPVRNVRYCTRSQCMLLRPSTGVFFFQKKI